MKKPKPPKQVTVIARRWFSQNTYHSVRVIFDDIDVVAPFTYGYGDHYMHTAGELILRVRPDLGATFDPANRGETEPSAYGFGSRWCRDHGIKLVVDCVDVQRKGELHSGGIQRCIRCLEAESKKVLFTKDRFICNGCLEVTT